MDISIPMTSMAMINLPVEENASIFSLVVLLIYQKWIKFASLWVFVMSTGNFKSITWTQASES